MSNFIEINYEIEAVCDEYGEFPLQCATLLFDLLGFNSDIIIKNKKTIKPEKTNIIQPFKNDNNVYYELPQSPEGDYCLWIKEKLLSNKQIVDILNLQGIYLSYIVPNDFFNWDIFLKKWKEDVGYLLESNQATFICNIIDMDRVLSLNFNTNSYSEEFIWSLIDKWEKMILDVASTSVVKRIEQHGRGKYCNKHLIRLCLF